MFLILTAVGDCFDRVYLQFQLSIATNLTQDNLQVLAETINIWKYKYIKLNVNSIGRKRTCAVIYICHQSYIVDYLLEASELLENIKQAFLQYYTQSDVLSTINIQPHNVEF